MIYQKQDKKAGLNSTHFSDKRKSENNECMLRPPPQNTGHSTAPTVKRYPGGPRPGGHGGSVSQRDSEVMRIQGGYIYMES